MEVNEKFEYAQKLLDENKYGEAEVLFEELSEETRDYRFVSISIALNIVLSKTSVDIGAYDATIRHANTAIRWCEACSDCANIMEQHGDRLKEQYAEAYRFKGQAILESAMIKGEKDESCLKYLLEAADRGNNEARYYLGLYYVHYICEPEDNLNLFYEYSRKQAEYFELYIENLVGDEPKEKIKRICGLLASLYEDGQAGISYNRKKAKYYRKLAER